MNICKFLFHYQLLNLVRLLFLQIWTQYFRAMRDHYQSLVSAFRISELQSLLAFAGKSKAGKKSELQVSGWFSLGWTDSNSFLSNPSDSGAGPGEAEQQRHQPEDPGVEQQHVPEPGGGSQHQHRQLQQPLHWQCPPQHSRVQTSPPCPARCHPEEPAFLPTSGTALLVWSTMDNIKHGDVHWSTPVS